MRNPLASLILGKEDPEKVVEEPVTAEETDDVDIQGFPPEAIVCIVAVYKRLLGGRAPANLPAILDSEDGRQWRASAMRIEKMILLEEVDKPYERDRNTIQHIIDPKRVETIFI